MLQQVELWDALHMETAEFEGIESLQVPYYHLLLKRNTMDVKDLTGFGEAAKELISRCANGLGASFQPFHLGRMAKAEAEVAILKAETDVEISKIRAVGELELRDIEKRAIKRLVYEEAKKQENIENVVLHALPEVNNNAHPGTIEDDWLNNFFDKCRLVSDKEMQCLWSKVLAGEANTNGSFSIRAVNCLQSLSKEEARNFQTICRFTIPIGKNEKTRLIPLIFDYSDKIYFEQGITLETLVNLQSIGLIHFTPSTPCAMGFDPSNEELNLQYFNTVVIVKNKGNALHLGQVMFTEVGTALSQLCDRKPIAGFTEYIHSQLTEYGYTAQKGIIMDMEDVYFKDS